MFIFKKSVSSKDVRRYTLVLFSFLQGFPKESHFYLSVVFLAAGFAAGLAAVLAGAFFVAAFLAGAALAGFCASRSFSTSFSILSNFALETSDFLILHLYLLLHIGYTGHVIIELLIVHFRMERVYSVEEVA